MLFCLHLKTACLGQCHHRKLPRSLHTRRNYVTPGRDYVGHQVINWWRWSVLPRRPKCLFHRDQHSHRYLSIDLTVCQSCAKLMYMPKNRIFKFDDGTETKEVEALSFKKAVKSFQGSSKAKMVTIEWTTKAGEVFVKDQKLPLGRKKKLGR